MDTETTECDVSPATAWQRVAISDELDLDHLAYMEFSARVLAGGLAHVSARPWTTSARSLDPILPHAVVTARWQSTRTALLDVSSVFGSDCLAYVRLHGENASATVAARELPVVADAEEWLRSQLPERQPTPEQRVTVKFWSHGGRGGHSVSRTIGVPAWAEVCDNYPHSVRMSLDSIMASEFRPADGGQLVLWHGEPGTGKTYALRALVWQWRSWCDVHYVTDPEFFFGGRTDYLMDVVLHDAEYDGEGRWRLLVLEDTGELLAADAKERTGQGLSRLLNLVDGIIGQGLRVLVLVTTNESLKQLHPAIARPGRCAAKVEFGPFPAEEAGRWLAERNVDPAGTPAGGTLADLYARMDGREVEARRPLGFAVEGD